MKIKHIIILLTINYNCFSQVNWETIYNKLPQYQLPIKFDTLLYSKKAIEINWKDINKHFRSFKGDDCFYWVGNVKEWASGGAEVDPGGTGGGRRVLETNGSYKTIPVFNKYYFFGKINLKQNFDFIIYKKQYGDYTLFYLMSYDQNHQLLSNVKILELETSNIEYNKPISQIPFSVQARITKDTIIEVSGAADFEFTQKYRIEKDGRFRVIETRTRDYPDTQYIIQDSDGYTNLRESNSAKSKILTKISSGSKVKVINDKSDWYLIEFSNWKGYVHKSRVKVQQ